MAAVTVNDADLDAFVASGLVVIDCWAPWCGPCRRMGPVIDALGDIAEGKIKVGKLNVDDNNKTSMRFGIQSIPTLLIFKNGEYLGKSVGFDGSLTPEGLMDKLLAL